MAKTLSQNIRCIYRINTPNIRYDVYQFSFDDGTGQFLIYDNTIKAPISTFKTSSEDSEFENDIYSTMIVKSSKKIGLDIAFNGNKAGPNGEDLCLEGILENYQ